MIIIPTYNERMNIKILISRIRTVLPKIQILIIDDNSADGTGDEIKVLQQTDPNIHLITRPAKAGFASAYVDGFKFALKEFNPEFIVTMDADLSHPPEKIPTLIEIAKSGKVGIGSRYVAGGAVSNWQLRRRILSRFGNLYARLLTKLPVKDVTGGFMAIPIDKIRQLKLDSIRSRGYAFLMELKVCFYALKAQFVELPITFEERKEGESKLARSIVLEGIKYPALVFLQRQLESNIYAWVLFIISFIVYVVSMPRTMYLGDSGEYIASAVSLGIPHPSGNPAYVLISHMFTWLPFSSPVSVGLFSVLSGSLGLVVFYFLLTRFSSKQIAFATALILGFSDMFWSQAIMAKVYAPMFLCLILVMYWLVKYLEQSKSWYIVASLLVLGLGTGIHQGLFLFAPLLLVALTAHYYRSYLTGHEPRLNISVKSFFIGCLLFLLGIATYAYLPIRSSMDPAYNFAEIFKLTSPAESWKGFSDYILRADYQDFAQVFNWNDKQLFLASFFVNLWKQFPYMLTLAPFGALYLAFRQGKFFLFTSLVFLINILAIILLRSSEWNFENGFLYSFYYLPSYAMAAFWIGAGVVSLFNLVRSEQLRTYLSVIFLLVPVVLLFMNYKANYQANFTFADEYPALMLEKLPPNSLLLTSVDGAAVDTIVFGLQFQQIVNGLRPDVTILNIADIFPGVPLKDISFGHELNQEDKARLHLTRYMMENYPNRPIYTTYIADNMVDGWISRSNGLVYALTQNPNATEPTIKIDYQKDLAVLESNLFGKDLLAQYLYAQAAACVEKKDLHCTQENVIAAIKYDDQLQAIDFTSFVEHRDNLLKK